MLNALVKFLIGSSLRVLCFIILYRNHPAVGMAKSRAVAPTHQGNIPRRPSTLYMPDRRTFELSLHGIAPEFSTHENVLRVSPARD
jgi:hypothetical protein